MAITTVAGNSIIQDTTNNARYIVDLINSNVPIYSGTSAPLKRKLIQANVHGNSGLDGVNIIKKEKLTGNAVEKIIEIIRSNPKQVTILALGPLTNIALVLQKDKSIASLIKEIVLMGGAIAVPGNKNRVAEFNIFVDPEAADIVFEADIKKTLVSLDVCNDIFLTLKDFDKLKNSDLHKSIKKIMKHYIEGIKLYEKEVGALMYDPLAAYYLINPKAYKLEAMDVKIETQGRLTRGMTVADRRGWKKESPNINVVTSIKKEIFFKDFFSILKT